MKAWSKLVVNGSLLGLVATMVVVGCGDDNKDTNDDNKGGEPAAAGSSSGGKSSGGSHSMPNAGEPSGGTAGTAGSGGAPSGEAGADNAGGTQSEGGNGNAAGADNAGGGGTGPEGEPSVARFCNGLSNGGDNLPFRLEIGEGQDVITFTADSFECAPADGAACLSLPLGEGIPIKMFEVGDPVPWYEGTILSEAGDQWVFMTDLETNGDEEVPTLDYLITTGQKACDDVVYSDIFE